MKKALTNVSCDGVLYEKGKVYSDAEVAHIDQSDFQDVGGEVSENTADQSNADEGKVEAGNQSGAGSSDNEAPEMIEHTVSQEDLDNNPDLAKEGEQDGDVIGIPKVADTVE